MKLKSLIAFLLTLIGVGMILFSNYISREVASGQRQIEEGQKQIDTTESLFSINPYSKEAGKIITEPGQKKIASGKQEISYYESLEKKIQMGGIILIVVGLTLYLVRFRKR